MKKFESGTVIAVGNQKGGVGKSTNTVHLAAAFGELGYSVLVIDLDPGAGSTVHLGVVPESFAGTLELLTTNETPDALAVTEGMPKGVSLIPSRGQLNELDSLISKYVDKTTVLERPLLAARKLYDIVLLDTPPDPGATTTIAAYCTADWFLLSALPHALAIRGANEALKDIVDVRVRKNPNLEILGVLITAVDRRSNLWREVDELIKRELPGREFSTMISHSHDLARLPGKPGQGRTILQAKNNDKHPVAQQYRTLAREIVHRISNRDSFIAGKLTALGERPKLEVTVNREVIEAVEDQQIKATELPTAANE